MNWTKVRSFLFYISGVFMICSSFSDINILFLVSAQSLEQQRPLPLVAFTTHHREPHDWIDTSLASFLLASQGYSEIPEVHFMVGDTSTNYVDNLKHHKNIYIHPLSPRDAKWWNATPRKRGNWRGGYNYVRCLNLTKTGSPDRETDGILIAEDDVIFTNDFWIHFQHMRDVLEQDFPSRKDYIIDCYHRFSFGQTKKPYRPYKNHFCCTQLMFYTSGAAKIIAQALQRDLKTTNKLGYDITIFRAAQANDILFLGAVPALAQHVGIHSSIGSLGFHITDKSQFENKDTPQIHYQKTNRAIHYGPIATNQLLHQRSHLTEQLRRHFQLLHDLKREKERNDKSSPI